MTTHNTIHAAATAALAHFHTKTRRDGNRTKFIASDALGGKAVWVRDICHAAHDGMMPDDYKYRMIRDDLQHIVEEEAEVSEEHLVDLHYEWAQTDMEIYNHSLSVWLGSHGERAGFCDEQMEQAGAVWPAGGVFEIIQQGFASECRQVYSTVIFHLAHIVGEDIDETNAA